jgi:ADP-ribose pyrophosphatase YjhB (NUDIX family)
MEPQLEIAAQLSSWIQQLRAIAQTGLAFNPSTYDRERYEALIDLAAKMAATLNAGVSLDPNMAQALGDRWRKEVVGGVPGYVTPKVGVGAVVFNDRDEILLIERPEGGWSFPTGWADIGYAPAQVAAKEIREETGLIVTPLSIIGVYDSASWRRDLNPHFYSIVFYCRLDGGELKPHPVETRGAAFFKKDSLPQPLLRVKTNWVEQAWKVHRGECVQAYFDP